MSSSNIAGATATVKVRIEPVMEQADLDKVRKRFEETLNIKISDDQMLSLLGITANYKKDPSPVDDKERRKEEFGKTANLLGTGSDIAGGIGDTLIGLVKTGVGIIQDVYDRLKSASPLLQTIEQLFNLAMTLFFMPLGNKLATEMLPAILELVSSVTDMWDAFEGKSLGEMFGIAIEEGVHLFGEYFQNLGEQLEDEGGLLGTIGHLINTVGKLIEDNLVDLIKIGTDILNFILSHLPEIAGLIVTAMGLHYSLMIAQIGATLLASSNPVVAATGGVVMGAGLVGVIASEGAGAYTTAKLKGYASGGHVDATPGGQLAVIAEGGEGETIVPDSKWDSVGRKTYNININGITWPELKDYIRDVVNEQTSESRLRSLY